MEKEATSFSFCYTKDVNIPFRVNIASLEGKKPQPLLSDLIQDPDRMLEKTVNNQGTLDLICSVQLFSDSNPLTAPVSTSYKSFKPGLRRWNEWVTLPINYSQLPINSQLAITIWSYKNSATRIPYGGTTIRLFDQQECVLKRGRQKLKIWLDQTADGLTNSSTPSEVKSSHEMDRLEKLIKSHESGDLPQVDWLDNLAFRQIERINKDQLGADCQHFLFVHLVQFEIPVVFSDIEYPGKRVNSVTTTAPFVIDPELNKENPIESKYRKQVVRSHKFSQLDKDLKPNAKIRDELRRIIDFSPVQELTDDEKNLLWKFRYYLTRHKEALTKFLKSITWTDPIEAKEATEMLPRWVEIGIDDALELLGPQFKDLNVRSYAVNRLRKANDTELELYLLQLVEAIKFEPTLKKTNTTNKSHLARFLIARAAKNERLGNFFYWYVVVHTQEGGISTSIYQPVLTQFLTALRNQPENGQQRSIVLKAQIKFIARLLELSVNIKTMKEPRPKKVEKLRAYLGDAKNGFLSFPSIPLPLDPSVNVVGCIPEESNVFKSSLFPLKITLKTDTGGTYPIMLKSGDDLRQDQLVIQIISLMDLLLRNENLDLKLTPYRILATGIKDGSLQFIPNETLGHVLGEYHGIIPYLQAHNPDPDAELGIKPEAMDIFVRSCAGYCVITYLLGVGDRHLDNLLICPDGHFFHADYGYILGRDPKPFPPMMKLPIQIIEGIGGLTSENYEKFLGYCFTAYTTLRKSANLILNLFALMTESSIPDIMIDREKVVFKVKEKFCLEMSEEEAMLRFQNLINDSVGAILPMVIDRLHNLAQYWRS